MHIKYPDFHMGKHIVIDEYEKSWLTYMSKIYGTNVTLISEEGELDRTSVYRLMSKHGFDRIMMQTLSDPFSEAR